MIPDYPLFRRDRDFLCLIQSILPQSTTPEGQNPLRGLCAVDSRRSGSVGTAACARSHYSNP